MKSRNLILLHVAAAVLLLVTWLCGEAIKTEAGSPFAALYYVLHIFPASVIFILILFEWLVRNQGKLIRKPDMPRYLWVNRVLHRAYYSILLVLPPTGIAVFFDFFAARPFYKLHGFLFDALLVLIVVNIASMLLGRLGK